MHSFLLLVQIHTGAHSGTLIVILAHTHAHSCMCTPSHTDSHSVSHILSVSLSTHSHTHSHKRLICLLALLWEKVIPSDRLPLLTEVAHGRSWRASYFPTQYILVWFMLSSPVHCGVLHAYQPSTFWCASCFPTQYILVCFIIMLSNPVQSTMSVVGCGSPVWTPTPSPAPGSWSSLWTPPWSLCPVVISSTPSTHQTWPARPTTTSSPPPRQRPTLVWRLGESADLFYLFKKVSLYNTSSFFI